MPTNGHIPRCHWLVGLIVTYAFGHHRPRRGYSVSSNVCLSVYVYDFSYDKSKRIEARVTKIDSIYIMILRNPSTGMIFVA